MSIFHYNSKYPTSFMDNYFLILKKNLVDFFLCVVINKIQLSGYITAITIFKTETDVLLRVSFLCILPAQ